MTIKWSFLSEIDYYANIDYLEDKWSENEVVSFIENVEHIVNLLSVNTVLFSKTRYRDTFKVPITKHITLFYSQNNDDIILLRFWNNFKNPNDFRLL